MKTVVIASGKGGTGKTTLTALLAHRAALEGTVVVVDADVEAANLPIALRAESTSCVEFPGGATAVVDPTRCIACCMCARACRFDAIIWPDETSFAQTYRVDPLVCEGCGLCAELCPSDAITMVPGIAGRACAGTATTGPIAYGELQPAQDLSGKLVTAVRERGDALADEHEADWILVDGPPGIGCPVIASVSGADLLVAVTEPSLSGEHDLRRLSELARQFSLHVKVVLNKADLSERGADAIRHLCQQEHIELIATIPFDPSMAAIAVQLADGDDSAAILPPESEAGEAVDVIWREIASAVGSGPEQVGETDEDIAVLY